MFSENDLKRLADIFHMESHTEISLPPLIPLRSGWGFLKAHSIKSQLRRIVLSAPGESTKVLTDRLTVDRLAQILDIKSDYVADLLPENDEQSGWILAENKQIITSSQYHALIDELLVQSQEAPITRLRFIDDHQISDQILTRLVREHNLLKSQHNDRATSSALLEDFTVYGSSITYSKAYRNTLEADVLKSCQEADRPYVFSSSSIRGHPPTEFLYEVVNGVVRKSLDDSLSGLRQEGEEIVYTPSSYLAQQQNKLIDKLQSGEVDRVAVAELEDAKRLGDTQEHLKARLNNTAIVLRDHVISKHYFNRQVLGIRSDLDNHGFATIRPHCQSPYLSSEPIFSKEDSDILSKMIIKTITDDWASPEKSRKLEMVGDFILRKGFLEELSNDMAGRAKLQAQDSVADHLGFNWEALLQEKESQSPILSEILRQDIRNESNDSPKKIARDAFAVESQRLKQEADVQFKILWQQRLMVKLEMYQTGIEALTDGKLREELRHTLEAHVLQNLLPDVLQKAERRKLISDKAMRRNIDNLKVFLDSAQTEKDPYQYSFSHLIAGLQTFARKQKIDGITEDELQKRRDSQVSEMVMGMEEDYDPPRLFLTLVVVLLSNTKPGIVYATGKFAPRLLKQLRGTVDADQLETLEKIKQAVKAGDLSPDQRSTIRKMAKSVIAHDR